MRREGARRPRRGRPRAGEEAARRDALLDAAFDELVERGYDAATTLAIATRAGSSKETIYAWFGSKEGLFAALIRRNAEQTNAGVRAALENAGDPAATLTDLAVNLLTLLLGASALALNRAAMRSPELARVLLAHGRHRTGPLVEEYLARLAESGAIAAGDQAETFRLFYGLVVQDSQIRALLGEQPPSAEEIRAQAHEAVVRFLRLTAPESS